MARNKYTAEQKASVLARASEIGISAAAKEFGIDRQTISRWKKAAENPQGEVKTEAKAEGKAAEPVEKIEKADVKTTAEEVVETTAEADVETTAEEVVETPVEEKKSAEASLSGAAEQIVSGTNEAKAVIQEKVGDAVAVAQTGIKKAARKAKKAVKKTTKKVKATAEKTVRKARAARVEMIFETNAGQQITPEAIAERIPKGVDAAYIKLEENKIYWVKGEETGSVDIWAAPGQE